MRRFWSEKVVRVEVIRAMAPPLGLRKAYSPNEVVELSNGLMSHDTVTHTGRRGEASCSMSVLLMTISWDSTSGLP